MIGWVLRLVAALFTGPEPVGAPTKEQDLAKIRREGHGLWKITFTIEGYEGHFEMLAPGRLTEKQAIGHTILALVLATKEHAKWIHHVKSEKIP